jgi:hypothetical protein
MESLENILGQNFEYREDTTGCKHPRLIPPNNEPSFLDREQEGRLQQGHCIECGFRILLEHTTQDGQRKRTGNSWIIEVIPIYGDL